MYKVILFNHGETAANGRVLLDTSSGENPGLTQAVVETKLNEAGSFNYSIVPTHPLYGMTSPLKVYVSVEEDGTEIFYGRILSVQTNPLTKIKSVTCEGALAFLLDCELPKDSDDRTSTAANYFTYCVSKYNEGIQNDANRLLKVGVINVTGASETHSYNNGSFTQIQNVLKSQLLNAHDGFFRIRRDDSTGEHYIDWVEQVGQTNPQAIAITHNVISQTNTESGEDIFSIMRPVGNDDLTLSSTGLIPVSQSMVDDYGPIIRTVTFDASDANTLQAKALDYIEKIKNRLTITGDISFVDFHFLDGSSTKVHVGDVFTSIEGYEGTKLTAESVSRNLLDAGKDKLSIKSDKELMSSAVASGANSSNVTGVKAGRKASSGSAHMYKFYHETQTDASLAAKNLFISAEEKIETRAKSVETYADEIDERLSEEVGKVKVNTDNLKTEWTTYKGTEIYKNKDHIDQVCGLYQVQEYTDPATGETVKNLVVQEGSALYQTHNGVIMGVYDNYNLTGGMMAQKINGQTETLINGNRVKINGNTTINDVIAINENGQAVFGRTVAIGSAGPGFTQINGPKVTANTLSVRENGSLDFTIGHGESAAAMSLTGSILSTMIQSFAINDNVLTLTRMNGTFETFNPLISVDEKIEIRAKEIEVYADEKIEIRAKSVESYADQIDERLSDAIGEVKINTDSLQEEWTLYKGTEIYKNKEHIDQVCGLYKVVETKDPDTGEVIDRKLIVTEGTGLYQTRDGVALGIYDNGNLTGGMMAQKINGQTETLINGNRVKINGNTTINDVIAINENGQAVFGRTVAIGSAGPGFTQINGPKVTANTLSVRENGSLDFTIGHGESAAAMSLTGSILSTMIQSFAINDNVLTLTRMNGTFETFSKATSLSGAWSGGSLPKTLTVTASPQGNTYQVQFDGTYSATRTNLEVSLGGSISIETVMGAKMLSIPVNISRLTGTSSAPDIVYQTNISAAYNALLETRSVSANDTYTPGSNYIGIGSIRVNVPNTMLVDAATGTAMIGTGGSSSLTFSAGITYSSATHTYIAKAIVDGVDMEPRRATSGTEAYTDGKTDGHGEMGIEADAQNSLVKVVQGSTKSLPITIPNPTFRYDESTNEYRVTMTAKAGNTTVVTATSTNTSGKKAYNDGWDGCVATQKWVGKASKTLEYGEQVNVAATIQDKDKKIVSIGAATYVAPPNNWNNGANTSWPLNVDANHGNFVSSFTPGTYIAPGRRLYGESEATALNYRWYVPTAWLASATTEPAGTTKKGELDYDTIYYVRYQKPNRDWDNMWEGGFWKTKPDRWQDGYNQGKIDGAASVSYPYDAYLECTDKVRTYSGSSIYNYTFTCKGASSSLASKGDKIHMHWK